MVAAVACLSLALFASGLYAESFVDEYAYISQSYYADLFFRGQVNDWRWLDLPAYDLPPLPKYLIGYSLRLCQQPMPGPVNAHFWYGGGYRTFGSPATLTAARVPIILVGALGCVAIFACGALIKDDRMGLIAAVLLMLNPLFRLHAHRAMSDVPCETFMLAAMWLALWAWRRAWSGQVGLASWLLSVSAGLAAGLALLSKFNGFLALMVIVAWSGAAVPAPGLNLPSKLRIAAGAFLTCVVALALFVALNPFLTARPTGNLPADLQEVANRLRPDLPGKLQAKSKQNLGQRFRTLVEQRLEVSNNQKDNFAHNALNDLGEKCKVFVVQGFGRFGLLGPSGSDLPTGKKAKKQEPRDWAPFGPVGSDSRVRYAIRQDWGLIVWAPLVLIGLVQSLRLGSLQFRTGEPPTGIALVIWVAITWIVVTVYLPMAWDRYLMPPQSVNSLLAALAISSIYDRVVHHIPLAGTRT
jgi:4-amino-4-deoxy-L-arabinose transferase-like glycosyltransferase